MNNNDFYLFIGFLTVLFIVSLAVSISFLNYLIYKEQRKEITKLRNNLDIALTAIEEIDRVGVHKIHYNELVNAHNIVVENLNKMSGKVDYIYECWMGEFDDGNSWKRGDMRPDGSRIGEDDFLDNNDEFEGLQYDKDLDELHDG